MTNARLTVYSPNGSTKSANGQTIKRRPRLNTTLTNIRSQIESKQAQGKTLTAIEQHISKKVSQKNLKPSLSSAIFSASKSLAAPGMVVLLALAGTALFVGRAPITAAARSEAAENTGAGAIAVAKSDELGQGSSDFASTNFAAKRDEEELKTVIASVKESARVKLFGYATIEEAPEESATALDLAQPDAVASAPIIQGIDPELARKQGLIKFLAGMIAVHQPDIQDCGSVARDIVEISSKEQIDPFFVASIISIESRFFSSARSKVGATGLMQLMPRTAEAVAKGRTPKLTDPHTNIRLGVHYIKELERKYRGNRYLALSAYNWGPTNVDKGSRIPASVSQYATKIMERTSRWRKHFKRAEASATALNGAPSKSRS